MPDLPPVFYWFVFAVNIAGATVSLLAMRRYRRLNRKTNEALAEAMVYRILLHDIALQAWRVRGHRAHLLCCYMDAVAVFNDGIPCGQLLREQIYEDADE